MFDTSERGLVYLLRRIEGLRPWKLLPLTPARH